MKKIFLFLSILFLSTTIFAQPVYNFTGTVDWDSQRVTAEVSLDLASAGLRLPSGRIQAQSLLALEYLNLLRQNLLTLQADSSATLGDLVERGELSLADIDSLALASTATSPAFSPDMRSITSSHTIPLAGISSALLRHTRAAPAVRTLIPVSAAAYTGIIIIASEALPIHGMRSAAHPVPCLFPKVWDSEMNLIYERNMLETRDTAMVKYSRLQNIMHDHPSGLSAQLRETVGERPLRIFARGVFGLTPTDLIIDRNDALLIISSEQNRRLLSQGRVAVILDDSALTSNF